MMFWNNFVQLFVEAAPWLLLGYSIAVLLKYALPEAWLLKHLGNSRRSTTVKAALIGAPLPLCSCGVIPAALGLRRAGASKSATTAFLIATPETGVDSVAASYALLGPLMAVVRPIAAVTTAITAGLLVRATVAESEPNSAKPVAAKSTCCSSKPAKPEVAQCSSKSELESAVKPASSCCSSKAVAAEPAKTSCCASKAKAESKSETEAKTNAKPPARYTKYFDTLVELFNSSYRWLLIGLVFAALVQSYVPQDFLQEWGHGLQGMLLMVLIGIPMYICATASTPVAAGLVLAGVSPGAALVFMLAGPASNVATLAIVRQELGTKALACYLIAVASCAIAFGLGLDALMSAYGWQLSLSADLAEHAHEPWWAYLSAVVLAVLMVYVAWQDLLKPRLQAKAA